METEGTEKVKTKRKGTIKAITLEGVPRTVHNVLKDYQLKIGGERRKYYTIKQAYVEFLIEKTQTAAV